MSERPTVREDQHGTRTGYTYGCRCQPCRLANRSYFANYDDDLVSPATTERVFEALEREADMDGLAVVPGSRLGELAGISQTHANRALHQLAAAGRIDLKIGSGGRGGVHAVQIVGSR